MGNTLSGTHTLSNKLVSLISNNNKVTNSNFLYLIVLALQALILRATTRSRAIEVRGS